MTAEAPALIQYACERCKTRFILPTNERKLAVGGRFKAGFSAAGRVVRRHEGFGTAYDAVKQRQLAKMDDQAYQEFVQSFRFCHECRQFVCNECWSTSRKACLTCVAKSMAGEVSPRTPFEAPMARLAATTGASTLAAKATIAPPRTDAPRKLKWRREATMLALVVAIALLGLEGFFVLSYSNNNGGDQNVPDPTNVAVVSATPGSTQSNATAAVIAGNTGTADSGATPSATDSAIPSGTVGPTPSPATPMPQLPDPNLTCSQRSNSCTIRTYASYPGAAAHWTEAGSSIGTGPIWSMSLHKPGKLVQVFVTASGYRDSIAQTWREASNETPQPILTPSPTNPPTIAPTTSPTTSPTTGPTTSPTNSPTTSPSDTPAPVNIVVTTTAVNVRYGSDANIGYTASHVPTGGVTCSSSDYSAGQPVGSGYHASCTGILSEAGYTYEYVADTFSVTASPIRLTCTVTSSTITEGDPAPGFTKAVTGSFYGPDGWLTGPTCTTTYSPGDPPNTYTMNAVGTASSNYAVTLIDDTFSVQPAPTP